MEKKDLDRILNDISELKKTLSSYEVTPITASVEEIKNKILDLKHDISDIKKEILNPETGVIVRLNKLHDKITYIETQKIATIEKTLEELETLDINYRQISGFKENTVKFLWLFLGGILTMLIQIFSKV